MTFLLINYYKQKKMLITYYKVLLHTNTIKLCEIPTTSIRSTKSRGFKSRKPFKPNIGLYWNSIRSPSKPNPILTGRDAQNRVKNRFRVGSKPVPVLVTSSKSGSCETRVGSYPVLTKKTRPCVPGSGSVLNRFLFFFPFLYTI